MKRSFLPRAAVAAAATVAIALVGASARAAVITWQTPTTSSAPTDVSTAGTLVSAYALGTASNQKVNGVTFAGTTSGFPYGGAATITLPDGDTVFATGTNSKVQDNGGGTFGPTTGNFATGSTYRTLLSSVFYNGNSTDALVLTLNSLTVGHSYLFQTWVNDSRQGADGLTIKVYDGNGNSAILAANSATSKLTPGGTPGQYVIGTFTADATSQVVNYIYNSSPYTNYTETLANAFQLRDLGSVITPEPATLGLLGLGGLGLLLLGKRRKTA